MLTDETKLESQLIGRMAHWFHFSESGQEILASTSNFKMLRAALLEQGRKPGNRNVRGNMWPLVKLDGHLRDSYTLGIGGRDMTVETEPTHLAQTDATKTLETGRVARHQWHWGHRPWQDMDYSSSAEHSVSEEAVGAVFPLGEPRELKPESHVVAQCLITHETLTHPP
ncbi:hypothetical protein MJO28_016109 [Puccinia striiformis f. sp. tritici]|uniref:Uncharacterized protein n=1 Tax=Puccinia striiformis f. sp. tritici TaxID=168172 RepID=A0ACC0DQK0_9BASI|nr:hypothetical protein MJO28_016109 [Puccinia striiformis f. sp. tritici]